MAAIQVWTVGSLLTWTTDYFQKQSIDEPRLSAELLLAHALSCSRMALYTQFERVPPDDHITAFRELVKQRARHVPVAYLTGRAWFFSLEFKVTRDVLIPSPDTETLVEFLLQHARQRSDWSADGSQGAAGPAILDLCTGSGAIAIALAVQLPAAQITAVDISPPALAVARENAALHQVTERVTFLEGDLFAPLDKMPAPTLYHAIVSNPPYIPTAAIPALPPAVRDHIPRLALDGGADGIAFHRQIAAHAAKYLHPGGVLAMEMQYDQGPALQALLAATPQFAPPTRIIRDAAGHPRCIAAFRPAAGE